MANALRNIRRNQSEMAGVGRCNRYGGKRVYTFKSQREAITSFLNGLALPNPERFNPALRRRLLRESA